MATTDTTTTTPPLPPGLINSTPPQGADGVPAIGTVPTNQQVASYTPATATATTATSQGYDPNAFTVAPNATVAGQIKDIIASGSPLMTQAETNARNQMNQRGLINSTQAITAGQAAVYAAATPIATSDAATYAREAENTTNAQNQAKAFAAQAANTAGLTNAQLETQTGQFNSGQVNAALQQMAQAANTKDITQIQGSIQKALAQIQADTQLTIADKQTASAQVIAHIQADTTLSAQDKQDATNLAIQASQSALQTYLGQLQSSTQLSVTDKSTAAQVAIAAANNVSQQAIASLNANTQLSITQQQTQSAQIIAGMNNATTIAAQNLVNAGNLANIQANGVINTAITNLTDQNKLLLQSSQGAQAIYNTALQNLSNIITNPNLTQDQKTTALNDGVQQLNDALAAMAAIAGVPTVQSTLNFSNTGATLGPTATQLAAPADATGVGLLYQQLLGRAADTAGSNFYLGQNLTLQQVSDLIKTSPEYLALHPPAQV